ncbi:WhiB family transcriptional regulator [Dietzia kunjamensis]|uniref:WhiB family transcriptional regulator n=1 Tax=Dietzia kunjamensis TaxID=322509 RepID=UPI003890E2D9
MTAKPKPPTVATYWDSAPVPGEWAESAACAGLGLHDDVLHGESVEERDARYRAAGEVCRSCPVLAECNAWRLETPRQRRVGVIAGVVRVPRRWGELDLLAPEEEDAA